MKFVTFRRQASLIRNRLTKIKANIQGFFKDETPLANTDKDQILLYLQEVETKTSEFKTLLQNVANVEDTDYEDEIVFELEEAISELCVEIRTLTTSIVPVEHGSRTSLTSESSPSQASSNDTANSRSKISATAIKLPPLVLKTFDGSPGQWLAFSSLFEATVHSNTAISNIERFQYLLSSLQGHALQLVQNIPLTSDNYEVAWNILTERFHNDRKLLSHHLNSILDLPAVTHASVKNLRCFLSAYEEHSQALQALKLDVTQESAILTTILLRKVDSDLRRKFEDSRKDEKRLPEIKEFILFLNSECSHMEAADLAHTNLNNNQKSQHFSKSIAKPQNYKTVMLTSSKIKPKSHGCLNCQAVDHKIYHCDKFKNLNPSERLQFIQKNKWCTNCLSPMHRSKECKSEHVCNTCKKRHHSLLHLQTSDESEHTLVQTQNESSGDNTPKEVLITRDTVAPVANVANAPKQSTILLGTCLVKVTSPSGYTAVVRAVVDSASMVTCITEKCAQLLKLERSYMSPTVDGLSSQAVKTKGTSTITISSTDGTNVASEHPVLILQKITSDLPQLRVPRKIKDKCSHLILADPHFDQPGAIDILLDAGIFSRVMTGKIVSLGNGLPVAHSSTFGYLIIGSTPVTPTPTQPHQCGIITLLSTADIDLHKSIQKFWEIEEPPPSTKSSEEDELCENYFRSTVTRNASGSYVVRLPLKEDHISLGNSYDTAQKRFFSLEKQFNSKSALKEKYTDAINDYLDSGHMEACEGTQPEDFKTSRHYFLPHLPVIKEDSSTTKLRVVFDASAQTQNGVSLNDILYSGPKLQNPIVDVLIHFRRYPIVFSTDIKQMFRQIWVHPEDRNLLLLLWRDHTNSPLQIHRLTTVTFGLSCSPFLALRTLQKLVEDAGEKFPLAANALKSQVYVDDIFLGADKVETALELQRQVIDLLACGNFELRKWTSNSSELTESVPEDHRETPLLFNESEKLFHVLGIKWLPESDQFAFNFIDMVGSHKAVTKRLVLSSLSKIFDPCGWLSPVTFWAKALVQQLWTLGLGWDEPLPPDLAEKWLDFVNQLPLLNDVRITRCLNLENDTDIQIHGFCDASESGFAAVVYLRCVNQSNVTVHLLIAKSRVAPLKKVSIPRLELCGAHLLAKLIDYCMNIFTPKYKITVRAWSDSTVALAWIKTAPYRLKTFVANRVSQIQDWVPPHLWSHVPTHDNPADCASRGLKPANLPNHPLWFSGPPWLRESPNEWPSSNAAPIELNALPDIKQEPFPILLTEETLEWDMLTKYSSWSKLQRVMSYVIRFVKKLKKENCPTGSLKIQELDFATQVVCKIIQKKHFQEDIKQLHSKDSKCSTRLQRLSPFLDDFGLIRVGGRIQNSELSYAAKHPIVLPKSHHVVNLLIDYHHIKYLHVGPKQLQATLSQQFWILSARDIIRSRIFKCITCFRCRPQKMTQKMGNLPKYRITPTRTFNNTGVDYLGPMLIKANTLRKSPITKCYLCLFVCLAVKAVHIEVVTNLSTEAYLAALTRFVSRRGLVSNIYSDNATNFVGASAEMSKIIKNILKNEESKEQIHRFATEHRINFHFIPPAAPHQGGIWERSVRSVKHHLKRVIGDQLLTLEELNTLAIRTEAMLNSRPLTPLSQDPSELDCLTPGHFLVGGPLIAPPEPTWDEVPKNRLSRWQLVQSLSQSLWKKWSMDYLHTLQQRTKWTKTQPNLKKGDLVLIHDHQSPPLAWKMGRIEDVSPGADGLVRVIHLHTAKGPLTRAVTKVSLLPIEQ